MEKTEQRAVIKYLQLPKEIHADMANTLGNNAPSYRKVKEWCASFKHGRTSTEDDHRSGRPCEVTSQEIVDSVLDTVMQDRRTTIRQIAQTCGISKSTVERILHEKLNLNKVSARWVPRMLTADQKRRRVQVSQELLVEYRANPESFIRHRVTQDETWVHHFDPETKARSMQWKHQGSPAPKKFKVAASSGKVMASIFWDDEGVIMVDYLKTGQTINGEYYANELRNLREAIKNKRRGKLRRGVWLLQDNAPAHTAHTSVQAATSCGFRILPHPAYSPDLAPSDFYLFPNLKTELRGKMWLRRRRSFWSSKKQTGTGKGYRSLRSVGLNVLKFVETTSKNNMIMIS